jgi:hypothetical protein
VYSVHVYKNTRRFKLEHSAGEEEDDADGEQPEEETETKVEVRSCCSWSLYKVSERRGKTDNWKVYVTFLAFSILFLLQLLAQFPQRHVIPEDQPVL